MAGDERRFPASGPARWTALRQHALGEGSIEALILCRYELARPHDKRWTGWTDGQTAKARQGFRAAEREDLIGPRTIASVTIGCMLSYRDFCFPDNGWRQRHPKLAAWYEAVKRLPSRRATKLPAG